MESAGGSLLAKVEINALWMQSNAAVLWKKEKERSCIEARVEATCSYNRPVIFWFAENIDRRWSSLASFPYSQFSLSWEQVDSEKKNLHSITYIHVYIELVSFLWFFFFSWFRSIFCIDQIKTLTFDWNKASTVPMLSLVCRLIVWQLNAMCITHQPQCHRRFDHVTPFLLHTIELVTSELIDCHIYSFALYKVRPIYSNCYMLSFNFNLSTSSTLSLYVMHQHVYIQSDEKNMSINHLINNRGLFAINEHVYTLYYYNSWFPFFNLSLCFLFCLNAFRGRYPAGAMLLCLYCRPYI